MWSGCLSSVNCKHQQQCNAHVSLLHCNRCAPRAVQVDTTSLHPRRRGRCRRVDFRPPCCAAPVVGTKLHRRRPIGIQSVTITIIVINSGSSSSSRRWSVFISVLRCSRDTWSRHGRSIPNFLIGSVRLNLCQLATTMYAGMARHWRRESS